MRGTGRSGICARLAAVALSQLLVASTFGSPAPAMGASLPIPVTVSGTIRLVPGSGVVYVVIPRWDMTTGSRTTIVAVSDGRVRPGWPVTLPLRCEVAASDVDASVRAVCNQRAYALDTHGRTMSGWPVLLGGSATSVLAAVVRDGDLVALMSNQVAARLVTVTPAGAVKAGVRVRLPVAGLGTCPGCWGDRRLGMTSSGIAYEIGYLVAPPQTIRRTQLTMFDGTGVRAGWPRRYDGIVSAPAGGPDDRLYLTAGTLGQAPTRLLVLGPDGAPVPDAGSRLAAPLPTYGGFGQGPWFLAVAPLVARDGSAALVPLEPPASPGRYATPAIVVYRTDIAGRFVPGRTYRSAVTIAGIDDGPCETPSWVDPLPPAIAPDGTVYLLRSASRTTGDSAIGVGPDGQVRAGWPVTLRRTAAEFWDVAAGPDGTVYLLAVEPGSRRIDPCDRYADYSATLLTVRPDGTIVGRTQVTTPAR